MDTDKKTILLFGYHSKELARNWILEHGLTTYGYQIAECRTTVKGFLPKYADLTQKYWKMHNDADIILVTFMGFYFIPLAWILAKLTGKILVFDSLVSLYESEVEDRKRVSRWNPKAWFLFCFEWLCYTLSDLILLESPVYGASLTKRFHISEKKLLALPVGCRSDIFHPKTEKHVTNTPFKVMYQGCFIPVHGVETILEAASIIQKQGIVDIEFHLIGKGQTEKDMKKLAEKLKLKNVTFRGFLPTLKDVASELRQADIGLGMFRRSKKNNLCMPHKVYEVLSSRVALIMADTKSRKAMFGDAEIGLFIHAGNPEKLAEAILQLKNNPELRRRISKNGYEFSSEHYQPEIIIKPLAKWLDER